MHLQKEIITISYDKQSDTSTSQQWCGLYLYLPVSRCRHSPFYSTGRQVDTTDDIWSKFKQIRIYVTKLRYVCSPAQRESGDLSMILISQLTSPELTELTSPILTLISLLCWCNISIWDWWQNKAVRSSAISPVNPTGLNVNIMNILCPIKFFVLLFHHYDIFIFTFILHISKSSVDLLNF